MKKFFLTLPFVLSLECQATEPPMLKQTQDMMHQSAETQQQDSVSSYIPREVDVSRLLYAESKCYFVLGRCVLQPINVAAPFIASALMAASNACRGSGETASAVLGWTACGLSAVGFLSSVFLAKINDKLQGIDDFFANKEAERRANEMMAQRIAAESEQQRSSHTESPVITSDSSESVSN